MALANLHLGKPGLLELPVHIAGKHEGAVRHLRCDSLQYREAGMRLGVAIKREAVAVETPGEMGIREEGCRARDCAEIHPGLAKGRIGGPETLVAAEIRQAGIDAHAGSGGDQQAVSRPNGGHRAVDVLHQDIHSAYLSSLMANVVPGRISETS